MQVFIPEQSARTAHKAIKSSLKTRDAAQQCAVLWFEEILTRKLYLEIGYSSINQYAKLEREVKRAKQEAADKSVGQVSLLPLPPKKRPAAVVPVRVNMVMSPTQFARYERLWEKVRKQRNASADKVEALLEILESYVSGNSSLSEEPKRSARAAHQPDRKPPVQIHIHQCPDCAQASVQTSKGELAIGTAELARAQCDCQSPGCDHIQFLEVHHKVPRSLGGTNDQANLQILCSACHQLWHDSKIHHPGWQVKSPTVVYSWGSEALISPNATCNSRAEDSTDF